MTDFLGVSDNKIDFASFELNDDDFSFDTFIPKDFETRYIKPPKCKEVPVKTIKYRNAHELSKDLKLKKDGRAYCVINGSFIMGDFFEAFIVDRNYHVKKMTIQTLSLSQNNVDSLSNLLTGRYVDSLSLIVSDYFFSHERRNLIPYIYQELDVDDKFQLSAAGTHCKICLIETHCGMKIIIHGSANLRSSQNIEQIDIEENEALYDFNFDFSMRIEEKYKTINKSIRGEDLYKII